MSYKEIVLSLSSGNCQVKIGSGVVRHMDLKDAKKVFLFADNCLDSIIEATRSQLEARFDHVCIKSVKAGEELKQFSALESYYEFMAENGLDRNSFLLALGGGTIGDVGGFLAATYMRGMNWSGLPTTLLAQVDSCLGGKTGVNLRSGKNLVGAFYQAKEIYCDIDFLQSLSERDLISGLGEILKYGVVFDKEFFEWVCSHWNDLLVSRSPDVLQEAVYRSLQWKAKLVESDEFDTKGLRELLNFGHTFGHALEALENYEGLRHGEAVLVGMVFALHLSVVRGHLDSVIAEKYIDKIMALKLNIAVPEIDFERVLSYMKKDKKNFGDKFTFVLMESESKGLRDSEVERDHIREALRELVWPK